MSHRLGSRPLKSCAKDFSKLGGHHGRSGIGTDGRGRTDVYDYPAEVVREAVANALLHRDYSPYSRGTPVQITLYADRLVVASPGGLFGAITEDDLGGEGVTSTRNPVLAKLLQDVRLPETGRMVCENRSSGIPTMLRELRRAGSPPPEFHSRITRFKVIMPRHDGVDRESRAARSHFDAASGPCRIASRSDSHQRLDAQSGSRGPPRHE